jgi:hypothetical protein
MDTFRPELIILTLGILAVTFMLWVLWKFWIEERRR